MTSTLSSLKHTSILLAPSIFSKSIEITHATSIQVLKASAVASIARQPCLADNSKDERRKTLLESGLQVGLLKQKLNTSEVRSTRRRDPKTTPSRNRPMKSLYSLAASAMRKKLPRRWSNSLRVVASTAKMFGGIARPTTSVAPSIYTLAVMTVLVAIARASCGTAM